MTLFNCRRETEFTKKKPLQQLPATAYPSAIEGICIQLVDKSHVLALMLQSSLTVNYYIAASKNIPFFLLALYPVISFFQYLFFFSFRYPFGSKTAVSNLFDLLMCGDIPKDKDSSLSLSTCI